MPPTESSRVAVRGCELTILLLSGAGKTVRSIRVTPGRIALFVAGWLLLLACAALFGFESGEGRSVGAAATPYGSSLRADAVPGSARQK